MAYWLSLDQVPIPGLMSMAEHGIGGMWQEASYGYCDSLSLRIKTKMIFEPGEGVYRKWKVDYLISSRGVTLEGCGSN